MANSTEGYLWQANSRGSSGLPTEAVAPSTPHLQDRYDVVVIGAGLAGLVAARERSAREDLKVLLVGGRTWTAKALGQHFEMGGTWVHWIQPFVYAEITRYGLQRHLKTSSGRLAAERLFTPSSSGVRHLGGQGAGRIHAPHCPDLLLHRWPLQPRVDAISPRSPAAPWTKCDHVTARERLDRMEGESQQDKEMFDSAGEAVFMRSFDFVKAACDVGGLSTSPGLRPSG